MLLDRIVPMTAALLAVSVSPHVLAAPPPLLPHKAEVLRGDVSRLIEVSRPNRSVGTPGHDKAFDFLKAEFGKIASGAKGARVFTHEFTPDVEYAARNYVADFKREIESKFPSASPTFKKWAKFTGHAVEFVHGYSRIQGRNLILELKGTTRAPEVLYVGAHYDTITHDAKAMRLTPKVATEGADDNASGVAALLSIARELASVPHERTIRFVAFDYEEIFFLGAHALSKDLAGGKIATILPGEKNLGLIDLEMVGYTSLPLEKNPAFKLYTRLPGDPAAEEDLKLASVIEKAGHKFASPVRPLTLQNGFNRGDNWAFWQNGIPAICVSEDWETDFNGKNYHSARDKLSTVRFDYLGEIIRIVTAAIRELVTAS